MRILCIDDECYRIRWIQEQYPDAQVVWAHTPDQVIYYVREHTWDLICWDNDLGLKGQDGLDFAANDYVGGQAVKNTHLIWVWSQNDTCAPKITKRLQGHVAHYDLEGVFIFEHPFDNHLPTNLVQVSQPTM